MAMDDVAVGRTYEMEDGRKLRLMHEWTTEDGHTRVRFGVVEGMPVGFLDCSLVEFRARAVRRVNN